MNRFTHLLFSCGLLLVAAGGSCKKEAYDPLPPATQEGKGTLACRIDGAVWRPLSTDFKSGPSVARYMAKEKTLFVAGFNDRLSQGVSLGLSNFTGKTGEYVIDSSCTDLPRVCANVGRSATDKYADPQTTYITNRLHNGKIVITYFRDDGSDGIVSGTFAYEAQNPRTGKVVKITEGRFDMIYRTY